MIGYILLVALMMIVVFIYKLHIEESQGDDYEYLVIENSQPTSIRMTCIIVDVMLYGLFILYMALSIYESSMEKYRARQVNDYTTNTFDNHDARTEHIETGLRDGTYRIEIINNVDPDIQIIY